MKNIIKIIVGGIGTACLGKHLITTTDHADVNQWYFYAFCVFVVILSHGIVHLYHSKK